MKKAFAIGPVAAAMLAACASTGPQSSMSSEQLAECLQPNRRVMVEVNGVTPKPAPKPPAPPPKKPEFSPASITAYVQGNTAFDAGSAVLKDGGKQELDKLVQNLGKRKVKVNAVIVSGHTDRLEAASASQSLSEDRAKAVTAYLASKGLDQKLVFWEGKQAREPMAVTKFCS